MLSWRPRNDAPGSRAMYGISSRRSISATTSEPHSGVAGRWARRGTSRGSITEGRSVSGRRIVEAVEGAGATRAFQRVDPRLLGHERLPEALCDPSDLVRGERSRLADRHRVGEPPRVLLEVERQHDAARDIGGDHGDPVAAEEDGPMPG